MTKLKVYMDDERKAPDGWVHVANPEGVLILLRAHLVEEMSLDHDLGDNYRNGTWLIDRIEEDVVTGLYDLPKWNVHSANPVGAARMERVLKGLEGYVASPSEADDDSQDYLTTVIYDAADQSEID